jgi:hypothetical protein
MSEEMIRRLLAVIGAFLKHKATIGDLRRAYRAAREALNS